MAATDLRKPGIILLLVGAILSAVGAVFLILIAFGMTAFFETLDEDVPGALFGWVYGGLGVMQLIGAGFGFMAHEKARQGDMNGAFIFGLIGSLLPPLRIIMLLGAIFCKVSEDD